MEQYLLWLQMQGLAGKAIGTNCRIKGEWNGLVANGKGKLGL